MAYRNFTLAMVRQAFNLQTVQSIGLFSQTVPVELSETLTRALAKKAPLAIAIATEKAKSELLIEGVS